MASLAIPETAAAQAIPEEAGQMTVQAIPEETKTLIADQLGALVITIPAPTWEAPPGTIEHLHKLLPDGVRFKKLYLDPKSKFMYISKIPSEDIYIMRIEGNEYTFQSGPSPTRYVLSAREECIAGYKDDGTDYWLDKETGLYKP